LAHYRYADRLISLNTGAGTQYYHHDALGSTVNLTTATGAVQVSYKIDPWGHIRSQTGTSVNRQIFTGQEHDLQTGLIYFGARYYDPDIARFITQDPYLGDNTTPPSLHRYLYAYSNPTVYIDLTGYESVTTMLDEAATSAASEGKNLKLAGLVTLQAGYKLADFITFGWIGEHDKARDAYDSGEISGSEYAARAGKAGLKSGTLLAATVVTGGAAGVATRGASLTTRLVAAGAASGVGYQATEDAWRGELSSGSDYLKAAAVGAAGGVAARGAIGLKSTVGNASVREGSQILASKVKQKALELPKITQEVKNGLHQTGQKILQGEGGRLNPLNYRAEGLGSNLGNIKYRPRAPKRVNLPAWKKIDIDIDHIASGHMKGGSRVSPRKDLFPDTMSKSQVEKSVRQAYKHGKKVETQGDRVRVIGQDGGRKIEMWVNTKTKQIETGYPIN
jgi:RHS repeat-associated protein